MVDTQGPWAPGWLRSAKPPEPASTLTRAERPLGSPLAFLLTTPEGVTSSSAGDFVRGGTMPTAGRQSGQWASWREEGGETGQGCFLERLGLTSPPPVEKTGWRGGEHSVSSALHSSLTLSLTSQGRWGRRYLC